MDRHGSTEFFKQRNDGKILRVVTQKTPTYFS